MQCHARNNNLQTARRFHPRARCCCQEFQHRFGMTSALLANRFFSMHMKCGRKENPEDERRKLQEDEAEAPNRQISL